MFPRSNSGENIPGRGTNFTKVLPRSGRWHFPSREAGDPGWHLNWRFWSHTLYSRPLLPPPNGNLRFICTTKILRNETVCPWSDALFQNTEHACKYMQMSHTLELKIRDRLRRKASLACCISVVIHEEGFNLITAFYPKSESPPHGSVCRVSCQKFNLCVKHKLVFSSWSPWSRLRLLTPRLSISTVPGTEVSPSEIPFAFFPSRVRAEDTFGRRVRTQGSKSSCTACGRPRKNQNLSQPHLRHRWNKDNRHFASLAQPRKMKHSPPPRLVLQSDSPLDKDREMRPVPCAFLCSGCHRGNQR